MWERYGEYLSSIGGESYRDKVFGYIDREDSPRPVTFQLDLLRRVGFSDIELLHKNSCFAAFGAIKANWGLKNEDGSRRTCRFLPYIPKAIQIRYWKKDINALN